MLERLAELAARSEQLRELAVEKEAGLLGAAARGVTAPLRVAGDVNAAVGGAIGSRVGTPLVRGAAKAVAAPVVGAAKMLGRAAKKNPLGTAAAVFGAHQTAQHVRGKFRENQVGFDPAVQQFQMGEPPEAPGMIR